MDSIQREIHESCDKFVRETGLSPTRIYLGDANWDRLRMACLSHNLMPYRTEDFQGRPTYSGLEIYLASDPDHLHVTR